MSMPTAAWCNEKLFGGWAYRPAAGLLQQPILLLMPDGHEQSVRCESEMRDRRASAPANADHVMWCNDPQAKPSKHTIIRHTAACQL